MAELSGPQLLRCVPVAVQFLVILSYAVLSCSAADGVFIVAGSVWPTVFRIEEAYERPASE